MKSKERGNGSGSTDFQDDRLRASLAALVVAVASHTRSACAADAAIDKAAPKSNSTAVIREALDRKVTVMFTAAPFADVLSWLRQSCGLNVALDSDELHEPLDVDSLTVTFSAQGQPLAVVLRRLLATMQLAYDVRDDVLLITSLHGQSPVLELRPYEVRDLVTVPGPFGDEAIDCEPLIAALHGTVTRGPFMIGAGRIGSLQTTLLVSDTIETHQRTERLLAALREANKPHPGKTHGEPISLLSPEVIRQQQAMDRKLDRLVTVRINEASMVDAVTNLRDVHQVPLELDVQNSAPAGFLGESKVSLDVHEIPLRSALKRLLEPHGLAAVPHEGSLLITTIDAAADRNLYVVVYPVRDLVEHTMASDGSDEYEALGKLSESIRNIITPTAWSYLNSDGDVCEVPAARALVCYHGAAAHAGIAELLTVMRTALPRAAGGQSPAVGSDVPETSFAVQQAAAAEKLPPALITRTFLLDAERNPTLTAKELVRMITEKIEPQSWQPNGPFIDCVADQLIVRQTPPVQQRVTRLLRKLLVLATAPTHDAMNDSLPPYSDTPADEPAPPAPTPVRK